MMETMDIKEEEEEEEAHKVKPINGSKNHLKKNNNDKRNWYWE